MKEIIFLNKNAKKWQRFETMLKQPGNENPDEIAGLFIELTDDLAYAQTFYPESKTTVYLNSLAMKAHHLIYKNKQERKNRIIEFWKTEFPCIMYDIRKYLLYSFLIFFLSIAIGAISAANDDSFVRLILGDSYVNMTLDNIEKGDPMAVYKKANEMDMFLGITYNNVKVSFFCFVSGVFFSIGTAWVLFSNGIMLGSFEYFFHQHGLLYESILSVWIHGTLEIFAIIVSGAAGLLLGNSIMFPGNYKRLRSFRMATKKGAKISLGLVPIFIIAGFLEGFVTRHTHFPEYIRLGIIIMSILFIIFYFFIYPSKLHDKNLQYAKIKNNSF